MDYLLRILMSGMMTYVPVHVPVVGGADVPTQPSMATAMWVLAVDGSPSRLDSANKVIPAHYTALRVPASCVKAVPGARLADGRVGADRVYFLLEHEEVSVAVNSSAPFKMISGTRETGREVDVPCCKNSSCPGIDPKRQCPNASNGWEQQVEDTTWLASMSELHSGIKLKADLLTSDKGQLLQSRVRLNRGRIYTYELEICGKDPSPVNQTCLVGFKEGTSTSSTYKDQAVARTIAADITVSGLITLDLGLIGGVTSPNITLDPTAMGCVRNGVLLVEYLNMPLSLILDQSPQHPRHGEHFELSYALFDLPVGQVRRSPTYPEGFAEGNELCPGNRLP